MPRLLKDIRINEVSSVDRGAGIGVKMLIMKRDGASPGNGDSKMTDEEIKALVTKSATEASTAAVAAATKPLSDTIAKQDRELRILKMSDAHKAYMANCDEGAQKAFGDLADDKARDEYASKNPIKKREDPVLNADVAVLSKQLTDHGAQIIDLTKRLAASDTVAKLASFAKSAAELGATAATDGELMMKAYSGDAEAAGKWTARLVEVNKALKAQVNEGALFGEMGSILKGDHGDTAYAILKAKATDLRKTESGAKLTDAQAFTKVYEDPANAELVSRNRVEELTRSTRAQYA